MEETTNKRVRMNISLTAKGLAQWDCTAEFDSPEESAKKLDEAIKLLRSTIKQNGLKEAGDVA